MVGDDPLADRPDLRRGIREVRQGAAARFPLRLATLATLADSATLGRLGKPPGERPHEIVGGFGRRFAPRQVAVGAEIQPAHERLIVRRAATEQPLALPRAQREAVEKRAVSAGCRSVSFEEDRVAVLRQHPRAVRPAPQDRAARVEVALVGAQVEEEPGVSPARVGMDRPHISPPALSLVLRNQDLVVVPAPPPAIHPVGGLVYLARLGCERGLLHHDPVAVGHLVGRVSSIQRLAPDQRGGLGRPPGVVAGTFRDAMDRHLIRERQTGEEMLYLAGEVPDLDILGEALPRVPVGPGFPDRLHQDPLPVGRGLDPGDDSRLTHRRHLPGPRVDQRELGKGVEGEKILVIRPGEDIPRLIGGACRLPGAILNVRSGRDQRLLRRRSSFRRDALYQEGRLVRHPRHFPEEDGVDLEPGNQRDAAARCLADPEFDRVGDLVQEAEPPAVRRPTELRYPRIRGQGNRLLTPVGHLLERERDHVTFTAPAVGLRGDARPREAQHRFRQVRDRRIPPGLQEGQDLARRAERDHRRLRGMEHIQDFLGRALPGRAAPRGCAQHAEEEHCHTDNQTSLPHDPRSFRIWSL